ncbi:hypothetical protein NLK61_24785 [Pseudomonas fuscovaginae UPB0736]|uniref:DUF6124 family protein n=1 Tax=Pseudomonas asplenii TaxID=53407 RepID=UPI000289C784|nr:hypothetical protein [Pseudomonas fuscovaginae]UUQ64395.1 hypothetical protein NLK61_24785 [Pseudomonas fuscovaginae UPB0736]
MVKKITPDPPPCYTSSLADKAAYLSRVMHESLAQIESRPPESQEPALLDTLCTTAFKTVESSPSSEPALFCVQPGISAQVALTQVSEMLRSAELNADEVCPRLEGFERNLLMGLSRSITLSRTVVEALLEGTSAPAACSASAA